MKKVHCRWLYDTAISLTSRHMANKNIYKKIQRIQLLKGPERKDGPRTIFINPFIMMPADCESLNLINSQAAIQVIFTP